MHLVARRQRHAQAVQEAAQRLQLLVRRRGVDPVHAGHVQPLQLLGGGHVGQHHELLDQPVAVEPRARARLLPPCRPRPAPPCAPAGPDRACRAPAGPRAARGRRRRARQRQARPRRHPAPPGPARRSAGRRCASGRGRTGARSCARRRRSASRRTGSRVPRPGAGCTSRWRAPPAASARRGRGSRRCCRAPTRRGPAASPGGRSAPRRRWRRSAGRPSPSGSAKTASSKSRASSPSMVTSGIARRSSRRPSGPARRALGLVQRRRGELGRDVVGVDADQADRARVAHAAQPLEHAGRLQPVAPHAAAGSPATISPSSAPLVLAGRHRPLRLGPPVGRLDPPPARPRGTRRAPGPARRSAASACGPRICRRRSGAAGPAPARPAPAPAGRAARAPSAPAAAACPSHSTGRAIASPSGSVPVTCTTIASGERPGAVKRRWPAGAIAPARQVLQQAAQRHPVLGPEAELPRDLALADAAGRVAMKRRISSREGMAAGGASSSPPATSACFRIAGGFLHGRSSQPASGLAAALLGGGRRPSSARGLCPRLRRLAPLAPGRLASAPCPSPPAAPPPGRGRRPPC